MQHLTFGISNVILQFGKHGNSGSHRHVLIVVLLPVLAQRSNLERNLSAEIVSYYLSLGGVCHHLQNLVTIVVDGVKQHPALTAGGVEHNLCGCLQVLTVVDILHIGITAVGLNGYEALELIGKVKERVRYLLHIECLAVPLTHLLVVDGVSSGKLTVSLLVLDRGIGRALAQTLLHYLETVQYVR